MYTCRTSATVTTNENYQISVTVKGIFFEFFPNFFLYKHNGKWRIANSDTGITWFECSSKGMIYKALSAIWQSFKGLYELRCEKNFIELVHDEFREYYLPKFAIT